MGKKILVVEDEPAILKYMVLRLRHKGYEVITAMDGEKAMEIIRSETPDLVLLDIKLPRMNGYEVCRRMKADKKFQHIPVIYASADASIRIAENVDLFLAEDYLIKPFAPEEMFEKIETYLDRGEEAA